MRSLKSQKAGWLESCISDSCVLCFLCAILVIGCDEGSPFEPQNSTPSEIPGSLSALHFPTADGCSWEYVAADGGHMYTAKIAGTRNVGGFAAKILRSDSETPVSFIGSLYGFPIRSIFFTKDLGSYTEHAFELWLATLGDTFFQRNSPKRVLWSFPLYAGKEWIVWKPRVVPDITYTRKVVSGDDVITVPAGTFQGVFYIEEYASAADLPGGEETTGKYWLAPDVGIIKHEFTDPISSITIAYELSNFQTSFLGESLSKNLAQAFPTSFGKA